MLEGVRTGFMNGQKDGEKGGNSGKVEDIDTEMAPLKKPKKCRISLLQAEVSHELGSVERMNRLTPVKAIRKYCVQCAGSQKAPRNCEKKTCPLFVFRLGKSPGRAGDRWPAPRGPEEIEKILITQVGKIFVKRALWE